MRSISKKLRVIIMTLIIMLVFTGCNKEANTNTSGRDIPDKITIVGLDNEESEVNLDDIKKLEKVNSDVISISSSGEENEMNVTGGLLEELLQKHDISQKDLSGIRFIASDGYSIDVPDTVLKSRDIILAYEVDGEPLFEDSQPIRVVVPDERAMYWVKKLEKIELIMDEDPQVDNQEASKLIILDSTLSKLKEVDYEYYKDMDKAVTIDELLTEFSLDDLNDKVFIKAGDGLEKTEANKVFRDAYIKTTGEGSPMFTSPDMPKGMTVKNILWFSVGDTSFLSVKSAMESFDKADLDGVEGILLKDILKDLKLDLEGTYTFTSVDGYSVDIIANDLQSGILYMIEDGKVTVEFTELDKRTTVKDLLSIEIK